MAKKKTRKPSFSRMTTDELKDAFDPEWPFEFMSSWKAEMFQREEPLEKKLHSCLDWHQVLGSTLKHPLYVGYCDPERSALVNFSIEQKQAEIDRLIAKKKWYQVVFMHETAFLFDAFRQYIDQFDDKSYWKILAAVWTEQEQLWPNRKLYLQLFQSKRPQRKFLMTAAERRKLDGMPDHFPIYRGYIGRRGKGLSWTIDQSRAEWFARRFSILTHLGHPRLMEGKVRKKDVLAYFNGRKEKEIVVDPAKVTKTTTKAVEPDNTDDE